MFGYTVKNHDELKLRWIKTLYLLWRSIVILVSLQFSNFLIICRRGFNHAIDIAYTLFKIYYLCDAFLFNLQPEIWERLRMELRRVKVVCLSLTMKGHTKEVMMTWTQWTTHLQKRILLSIIEVPASFSFLEFFWQKKHQSTVLNYPAILSVDFNQCISITTLCWDSAAKSYIYLGLTCK